ncbi:unnamed protein product, partial [Urochloa humidicola]
STLPLGCVVIARGIPIPYTYDKYGPNDYTFFGSQFKEKADRAIYIGETALNWYLNNITSACQRCEQEGRYCGFSSTREQAFCQHHGSHVLLIAGNADIDNFPNLNDSITATKLL